VIRLQQASLPRLAVVVTMLTLAAPSVWAQTLPPTTRTVFKCEIKGKLIYSDDPCVGAQKLDVEPTRGIDSASGQRRLGADVQREHHQEAIAEIARPLTGMDAKQLGTAGRRTSCVCAPVN
jgi:hypothetical protein